MPLQDRTKINLEGSRYLDLAEQMISAKGIPLTGSQIIDFASKHGVLPYESYDTIVKTLQARIAEDITRYRKKSRFIRTGIGTYFLHRLAGQKTVFGEVKWSPGRAPREKPEHPHRILTVSQDSLSPGYILKDWDETNNILGQGQYDYQSEIRPGFVAVVTGVVLKWRRKVFSYRVGVHTHFEKIVGDNSIILRKFLDEFDLDFFETDGAGVTSSTARTVLPVLAAGRRSRLENGRLSKEERLKFFQVSEMMTDKTAMLSSSTGCFLLMSSIDLSSEYSVKPKTQRRLELNGANWKDLTGLEREVDDEDSLYFMSSSGLTENRH